MTIICRFILLAAYLIHRRIFTGIFIVANDMFGFKRRKLIYSNQDLIKTKKARAP